MKFNIVLAVDDKNGLGKNNDLAWRISADLKYFKQITTSSEKNIVIMGRKTWESIPEKFKPLSNRLNCVISRDISKYQNTENIKYFNNFDICLNSFNDNENIFLIGGATLYNKYINHKNLDKIYLTKVLGNFNCDVFFNGIPDNFELVGNSKLQSENNINFIFKIFKR